jgi:hypothetical protein
MNANWIKSVAKYVIGWCLIVFFVLLLSFIFSFLGTIMCAVLAGMAMGSAKVGRWHSLAVSVIFPGVIFGLLRSCRADLAERQPEVLALICFGAFWAIHAVASVLVRLEHKVPARAGTGPAGRPEASQPTAQPVEAAEEAAESLTMEVLEGSWSCAGTERERKLMEIKGNQLRLSIIGSRGQVRFRAGAAVQLNGGGPVGVLTISSPAASLARSEPNPA